MILHQKFRNDPLRGFRRNNAVFRIFTMHIPVFLGRFSLSNFYNFHNAEITKFQVFVHLSDFRVCTTQIVKLCKFSKCRNPKTVGFCSFVKFSQCRYSVFRIEKFLKNLGFILFNSKKLHHICIVKILKTVCKSLTNEQKPTISNQFRINLHSSIMQILKFSQCRNPKIVGFSSF